MRTDGNYVQVKVSPEEKEHFLHIANQCRFTEKLTLYKMLHGDELREHPPEEFWEVDRQIGKIGVNTLYLHKIGMDELASKVFHRYREFEQYLQIVRRDMVFMCRLGIDTTEKE